MLGIRVGKDLAVTGFDDGPLTTMVSPEITSVAVPVEPIANQLLDMLERGSAVSPPPTNPTPATRLVVRGSSGFTPRQGQ